MTLGDAFILILLLVGLYVLLRNIWCSEHLLEYSKRYSNVLSQYGLFLNMATQIDASPFDYFDFVLSGRDVNITRSSRKILQLIDSLLDKKITVEELQAMSDTPFTKLRT